MTSCSNSMQRSMSGFVVLCACLMAAAVCHAGDPPRIVEQPQGSRLTVGDTGTLRVRVADPTGVSYRWFFRIGLRGRPLPENGRYEGVRTAELTLNCIVEDDEITPYYCVAMNEFGSTASSQAAFSVLPRPGDVDGDGDVDIVDLSQLLANFGMSGSFLDGDLNNDGDVDLDDLSMVLAHFGERC